MPRRKLISSDEGTVAVTQHTNPCSDCPFRRDSLPGWLGGSDATTFVRAAHSDARMDCHVLLGAQCVGAAVYRANVCKSSRDPHTLTATRDRARVFASPAEFLAHHDDEASRRRGMTTTKRQQRKRLGEQQRRRRAVLRPPITESRALALIRQFVMVRARILGSPVSAIDPHDVPNTQEFRTAIAREARSIRGKR